MLEPLPNDNLINCPNCAEKIQANAILCRFCETGLSNEHFQPCPFCAESIRKEATFCRFCRSKLSNTKTKSSTGSSLFSIDDAKINEIFDKNLGISTSDPQKPKRDKSKESLRATYGTGVRQQVFEVIIRQALAGAHWREICAQAMEINNITPEEVENELAKRRSQDSH